MITKECPGCDVRYLFPPGAVGGQTFCAECGDVLIKVAFGELAQVTEAPAPSATCLEAVPGCARHSVQLHTSPSSGLDELPLFRGLNAYRARKIAIPVEVSADVRIQSVEDELQPWIGRDEIVGFASSAVVHFCFIVLLGLLFDATSATNVPIEVVLLPPVQQVSIDELMETEIAMQDPLEINLDELDSVVADAFYEEPLPDLAVSLPQEKKPAAPAETSEDIGPELPDTLASRAGSSGSRGNSATEGIFQKRLNRAGAKTGDVQISLLWNNYNDVDLHVITPGDEHIYFVDRDSSCGGRLDVDANAGGPSTNEPVENVFWPPGRAPRGQYLVVVHHYSQWDSQVTTHFSIRAKYDGNVRTITRRLKQGDPPVIVFRFTRTGRPLISASEESAR